MKDAVRWQAYDVVVPGPPLQGWRTQQRRATVSDGLGAVVVQLDNGDGKQLDSAHFWSALRTALWDRGSIGPSRGPTRGTTMVMVAVLSSASQRQAAVHGAAPWMLT
jgi:hypothetical protein